MITSFEVGAVFKILDEASPTLRKTLRQVRELNESIAKTNEDMAAMMKMLASSMDPAINSTRALAAEWKGVSLAAQGARRSIASASSAGSKFRFESSVARDASAARRLTASGVPAIAQFRTPQPWGAPRVPKVPSEGIPRPSGGGAGGRGGSGSFFVHPLRTPLPGGHASFHAGNATLLAAGAIGYGIYEQNQALTNAVGAVVAAAQPILNKTFTGPSKQLSATVDAIKRVSRENGFSIGESSTMVRQDVLGMAGIPFKQRLAMTPYLGRFAWAEGLLKHLEPQEADKAFIGLMHQWGAYSPKQMRALGNEIVGLSTLSFSNLKQMEGTSSYIAPTAQLLKIPRREVLSYIAASQRAGVTSSKAGTWFNALILEGLNPKGGLAALLSTKAGARRASALEELGLLTKSGDLVGLKLLQQDNMAAFSKLLRDHLNRIEPSKRAGVLYEALGSIRATRAAGLLYNPNFVRGVQLGEGQIDKVVGAGGVRAIQSQMMNVVPGFTAKKDWAQLTTILMDLGNNVLPPVNIALQDFDKMLKSLRGVLPKGPSGKTRNAWGKIGASAIEGFGAGAAVGAFTGPSALAVGGVTGLVSGAMTAGEIWLGLDKGGSKVNKFNHTVTKTAPAAEHATSAIEQLNRALQNMPNAGSFYVPAAPAGTHAGEKHSEIHLDGYKVGKLLTRRVAELGSMPIEGSAYHDATRSVPASDTVYSMG